MNTLKVLWIAVLAGLFAAFWVWYGGATTPLTVAEGRGLLDRISAMHAANGTTPGHSDFRANMERMIPLDDGREFYAVNLETAKPGPDAMAAEAAYGRIVLPELLKRGSFPIYIGQREGLMLGQYGEQIDRVAVVRYRSLRDMLEMNLAPAMTEGVPHKFAALAHTEVFITRPAFTVESVRLTLALFLILVGAAGWRWLPR
jgi:hypothetical protein